MSSSLVVLTDFFAVSNRALSYAAGLALPLQAHLVLLHVRHNGLLAPASYPSRHTPQAEYHTTHALQQLAATQPVPAEVDISEEFLSDAVRKAIVRHHPLLLVLGRPGAAATPDEVLTSTAMDLLRHAPHPLLVVPAAGWDTFPPRRLLLAVDGEPFRLCPHQNVLRRLLHATQGTLNVVHVATTTTDNDDDDQPTFSRRTAVLRSIQASNLVPPLAASQVHEVYQPTVVGGILQEAARQEADLLVVVARRHSLLGGLFHRSVAAQVLHESPIPVLLLPAED